MSLLRFVFADEYLAEVGLSASELERTFLTQWLANGKQPPDAASLLAREILASATLGPRQVGYMTLLAQSVPQRPFGGQQLGTTCREQFEIARAIMAEVERALSSNAQILQVARTNWTLGMWAYQLHQPDLASAFQTRAAETYVRLRRWADVATLYANLGYCDAGAGLIGSATAWLSLAAEVCRSQADETQSDSLVALSRSMRSEPAKYFTPSIQIRELLSSPGTRTGLVEIFGLGLVAFKGISHSMADAMRVAASTGDALLQFVSENWPSGAITAAHIELRTVSRILREPSLLDDLEPRALETLVAYLFEGFAASVERTKETRDGGYDVGATFLLGDVRCRVLIETKQWKEERKVGLATVDRLLGVKHRLGADKVVLATTSSFSTVARAVAGRLQCEIELVDRAGLSEWVRRYLLPVNGQVIELPSIIVGSTSSSRTAGRG